MARTNLIQIRRGSASTWTSVNPTLSSGEAGYESDSNRLKIGNGTVSWSNLSYLDEVAITALGSISGSNAIDCYQNKKIQTMTLGGTATTFTKGSGWTTSSSVSQDVTLIITVTTITSVTWTIVTDWYRQPDSPLPVGTHVILLRSIGSSIIQGHYIGNKTN